MTTYNIDILAASKKGTVACTQPGKRIAAGASEAGKQALFSGTAVPAGLALCSDRFFDGVLAYRGLTL
jgi:hypothetical protein